MSNPGVVVLAETHTARGENFRIEDNIGEAIHLHLGEMRVDFSIQDFLTFSSLLQESISTLIEAEGFKLEQIDPIFLASLGDGLCDLVSIDIENIKLSQLEVYSDSWLGPRLRPLTESRMYLALLGHAENYVAYRQENFYGQTNLERLFGILEAVREKGYPYKEQYIVLFNDQDIIRDGQHRASALYFLFGDCEIPVLRMQFRKKRFQLSRHPWLWALPGKMFRLPLTFIVWCYRRLRRGGGILFRLLGLR